MNDRFFLNLSKQKNDSLLTSFLLASLDESTRLYFENIANKNHILCDRCFRTSRQTQKLLYNIKILFINDILVCQECILSRFKQNKRLIN